MGEYAVVVGGVNIDIGGRSFAPLVARDSNPGRVTVSLGGVGRNIAHNMRLLGLDVRFLTALGDDPNARRITDSCAELGIDLSGALRVPGGTTPTYLFLNDADGDMALAISDMEICERLMPEYLAERLSLLNGARLIVADTNLPARSLAYLAEHCAPPIFADPVSTAKAEKLFPILGRLHTLKPNRIEAERLSGVKIVDGESLRLAARTLLDTGLKRVFISLGASGVFAAEGKDLCHVPCCPARLKNATGAGDAFMAALAWAYCAGADVRESANAAAAAAAIAAEGAETINPALSAQAVRARMRENQTLGGIKVC